MTNEADAWRGWPRALGAGAAVALLLWAGVTLLGPSWYATPWWAVSVLIAALLVGEAARGLLSRRGLSVRVRAVAVGAFALALLGDLALRQAPRRALFPAALPIARIAYDASRNTAWDTPNTIETRTVIARLDEAVLYDFEGRSQTDTQAAWTRILPEGAVGGWQAAPVQWPDAYFDLPEVPYDTAVVAISRSERARWVRVEDARMLIVDPAGLCAIHVAFSVPGSQYGAEGRIGW